MMYTENTDQVRLFGNMLCWNDQNQQEKDKDKRVQNCDRGRGVGVGAVLHSRDGFKMM